MAYPTHRMRRLRGSSSLRALVRETRVGAGDLIAPIFVQAGEGMRQPIASMPGQYRFSPDTAAREASELAKLGVGAVILFGIPDTKDRLGSGAADSNGPVAQALRNIKNAAPGICTVADVCACEYTDHGHCGVMRNGQVDNDASLDILARAALCYARAGAEVVAPSDMMDGRVGAIRRALDAEGFINTSIMAYAAKFAGAFYGPFRDAAASAPAFGDRRGYQMDIANRREALREIALDIDEGADIVLIKPALYCLDIIREARDRFGVPLCAYNVSAEYAMVKAAAERGWIDEEALVDDTLTSIKRAGADLIISYHARQWVERANSDRSA